MERNGSPRILFLDTNPDAHQPLVGLLRERGYESVFEDDPEIAVRRLRGEAWNVLLAAVDADVDLVAEALLLPEPPAIILFDDFGSDDAFDPIELGVFDCIRRPVEDEEVALSICRAVEQRDLAAENRRLRDAVADRFRLGPIHSRDERMRAVFQTLEAVAETHATVLLGGESGTGKTLLARTLHGLSDRSQGPFVEVNCGAIPENLLESELFGHVEGAFTGASKDRAGKFEAADGGTLFLDEIGVASPDLQIKLLRALQDRCFERVGDTRTRTVDVRLVAATNLDLAEEVAAGRFREDLYYRVRVVAIELPPLRERPVDIPGLAREFLARFAAEYERPAPTLGPDALAALVEHPWPGNVRELQHSLERAVLLARRPVLEPADLGLGAAAGDGPGVGPGDGLDAGRATGELAPGVLPPLGPLKQAMEAPERNFLLRALEHCGGNRQRTAALLEINRTTLFNKMRKYNLLEFPSSGE